MEVTQVASNDKEKGDRGEPRDVSDNQGEL